MSLRSGTIFNTTIAVSSIRVTTSIQQPEVSTGISRLGTWEDTNSISTRDS